MVAASISHKFGLGELFFSSPEFLDKMMFPAMSVQDVENIKMASKGLHQTIMNCVVHSRSFQYERYSDLAPLYRRASIYVSKSLEPAWKWKVMTVFWRSLAELTKTQPIYIPVDALCLKDHMNMHVDLESFLPLFTEGQSAIYLESELAECEEKLHTLSASHQFEDIVEEMYSLHYTSISHEDAERFFPKVQLDSIFPPTLSEILSWIPSSVASIPDISDVRKSCLFDIAKLVKKIVALRKKIAIFSMPQECRESLQLKVFAMKSFVLDTFETCIRSGIIPDLNLDNCHIGAISSDLLKLKLHVLKLRGNQFKTIPLSAYPEAVSHLYLSHNPITDFSHLDRYTSLVNLDMSHTGLRWIPELTSLRKADFSSNRLITLPQSIRHLESICVYDNPLIYISPEVLTCKFSDTMTCSSQDIPIARNANHFWEEICYEPVTSLGNLYKLFVRPQDTYDREEISDALLGIPQADADLIYRAVWEESGCPITDDLRWGEHHALDELSVLALAVRRSILERVSQLSMEKKRLLHLFIAQLSGHSFSGDEEEFGRLQCYGVITKLSDALALVESGGSASPKATRIQMHFNMGLIKKCYLLKEIMYASVTAEDSQLLQQLEVESLYIRPIYDLLVQYFEVTCLGISSLPQALIKVLHEVDPYMKRYVSSLFKIEKAR